MGCNALEDNREIESGGNLSANLRKGGDLLGVTLGLAEEQRIFKGNTKTIGECFQQAQLRLAIGVLALIIFNDDIAGDPVITDNGD
jgi:hypothetical protein